MNSLPSGLLDTKWLPVAPWGGIARDFRKPPFRLHTLSIFPFSWYLAQQIRRLTEKLLTITPRRIIRNNNKSQSEKIKLWKWRIVVRNVVSTQSVASSSFSEARPYFFCYSRSSAIMNRETGKRKAVLSPSGRKSRSGPRGSKIRKTNNGLEATQTGTRIQAQEPTQAPMQTQVQAQSNRRPHNSDLVQKLVSAWIGGSQGQHPLMTQEVLTSSIFVAIAALHQISFKLTVWALFFFFCCSAYERVWYSGTISNSAPKQKIWLGYSKRS